MEPATLSDEVQGQVIGLVGSLESLLGAAAAQPLLNLVGTFWLADSLELLIASAGLVQALLAASQTELAAQAHSGSQTQPSLGI